MMGVDITTWRQRIGNSGIFPRCSPLSPAVCSVMRIHNCRVQPSLRLCAALAILLFIAGVEINPGPAVTCAELAALINNLSTQVAGLTTQVNAGFQQCNTKLDGLINDVNDLKAKYTALEATVSQLSADRDNLLHEVHMLQESAYISDVKARESNIVISGLSVSAAHSKDDIHAFLVNHLHIPDQEAYTLLTSASIRVISDGLSAVHKALVIVSLASYAARNRILSLGKHLQHSHIFMFPDLPKAVQNAHKRLRPFFLAARHNKERCSFIGSCLRIGTTTFAVSDISALAVRFPNVTASRPPLNP